ncbi:hypothetical protein [Enterovibrio calviensis]|uniref:hypothetical protein n=1 Tax=Enterovibrio calviensis TaxID=91359 RepID=UPI0004812DB9|nr:hypothetical protein [Enterovibrio calviensis]
MKKASLPSLPNPINSNPALDAQHVIYLAGTGGGKTSAVKLMGLVPKGAQAVFFDPYRNYAEQKFQGQMCHSTSSRAMFLKALAQMRRKGAPFKLAYVPRSGATSEELEFFASVVWALGNGNAPALHTIIEELASCAETSGKLKGRAGELLRGGRQFGLVVHSVFQKGQEVPKTVTDQSSTWWVGAMNSTNDAKWVADRRSLLVDEVASLVSAKMNKQRIGKPIAEYILISDGIGNAERGALHCVTGVKKAATSQF